MIIDRKLTQPILDWCMHKPNRDRCLRDPGYHYGNVVGQTNLEYMQLALIKNDFPYESLLRIEKQLMQYYNFKDFYRDNQFGTMISYSEKGHEVHEHTDENFRSEDVHTRINLMISKPEEGGLAIINEELIEVEENESWLCVAGHYKHSSTEVKGEKPRIVLSFGYQVNKEELKNKKWI